MNDVESTPFSGYHGEICLKQEQQVVEEFDFANISQCNIERLVFDKNDHERSPFPLNFCCSDNIKRNRSLLVIVIQHLVSLVFCIIFLTLCEADNRFASGLLVLLSTCSGHILPIREEGISA